MRPYRVSWSGWINRAFLRFKCFEVRTTDLRLSLVTE
jgi:hypothetical protein